MPCPADPVPGRGGSQRQGVSATGRDPEPRVHAGYTPDRPPGERSGRKRARRIARTAGEQQDRALTRQQFRAWLCQSRSALAGRLYVLGRASYGVLECWRGRVRFLDVRGRPPCSGRCPPGCAAAVSGGDGFRRVPSAHHSRPSCSQFAHRPCAYTRTSQYTSTVSVQVRRTAADAPIRRWTGWWGSNPGFRSGRLAIAPPITNRSSDATSHPSTLPDWSGLRPPHDRRAEPIETVRQFHSAAPWPMCDMCSGLSQAGEWRPHSNRAVTT